MTCSLTQTPKGFFGIRSDFDLKMGGELVKIEKVRSYGKLFGWILYKIGYASKTSIGSYVNMKSFFKHLAETANHKYGLLVSIKVLADSNLKKNDLSAKAIKDIYIECLKGRYAMRDIDMVD